jgi:hypothetical protein
MGCPDDVTRMADMAEQLTYLNRYIRKPAWLNRANSSLLVSFPAAQSVAIASGTVTTVGSMTQKAGLDLSITELRWVNKAKWQNNVRSRIS